MSDDVATSGTSEASSSGVVEDKGRWAQIEALRTLNAHHINETNAMLREATAKAYGVTPRATPFPGQTTFNSSVTQPTKTGLLPAVALAGLLTLGGVGAGGYLLSKAKDLFGVPVNVTQNNKDVDVAKPQPTTPTTTFDPNNYQFNVIPYDGTQTQK